MGIEVNAVTMFDTELKNWLAFLIEESGFGRHDSVDATKFCVFRRPGNCVNSSFFTY